MGHFEDAMEEYYHKECIARRKREIAEGKTKEIPRRIQELFKLPEYVTQADFDEMVRFFGRM